MAPPKGSRKKKPVEQVEAAVEVEDEKVEILTKATPEPAKVEELENVYEEPLNEETPVQAAPPQPYPYPYPYGQLPQYPQQYPPYPPYPQQYPPYPPYPQDPDQEYYMQYYTQQAALSGPASGQAYETRRAQNQMGHYFNTAQYPTTAPPAALTKPAQRRVTKQDLVRFKRRKEEKKKMKNKWLFE